MADDDARDERLGSWLDVDPLDEVTRRRLVSTALEATREETTGTSSRPARWIAVAAAVVVVIVAGIALLTAPGGHDEQQASTPVRTPAHDQARGATPQAESAQPKAAAAGPVDVGDFGDLSAGDNLARLRAALESGTPASGAAAGAANGGTTVGALPCRGELPDGTVAAVGAGELEGRHAVVVLTELGDGGRSIDAVFESPCEVRRLS